MTNSNIILHHRMYLRFKSYNHLPNIVQVPKQLWAVKPFEGVLWYLEPRSQQQMCNLAFVDVTQHRILGHFPCKLENWLFTCCLIFPTLDKFRLFFTSPVYPGVNMKSNQCVVVRFKSYGRQKDKKTVFYGGLFGFVLLFTRPSSLSSSANTPVLSVNSFTLTAGSGCVVVKSPWVPQLKREKERQPGRTERDRKIMIIGVPVYA